MPEQSSTPMHAELAKLHSAACLSMTQFINGRHCSKLAHTIIHQLGRLLAHQDLMNDPSNRELYQQLLEHWQKVAAQLKEESEVNETGLARLQTQSRWQWK